LAYRIRAVGVLSVGTPVLASAIVEWDLEGNFLRSNACSTHEVLLILARILTGANLTDLSVVSLPLARGTRRTGPEVPRPP
jgi:hypothetical protein